MLQCKNAGNAGNAATKKQKSKQCSGAGTPDAATACLQFRNSNNKHAEERGEQKKMRMLQSKKLN